MKATMQQRMARIMLMLSLCVLFAVVLLSLFRIAFLDKQLQADVGNPGNPAAQRTIFLGTTGVSWDLVNPATAPNLLRAATSEQAKVANLVVKVQADTTCPDSGWLTLNTGVRTIGLAQADEQCRHLPIIKANHRTWQIADWEQYLVANDGNKYQPKFGNLAQVLAANSQQIGVIGAGAALAMGNESGNIGDSAIQLKSGMAGANLKTGMQQTKVQYFPLAPVQAGKARLVTAADNAVGKRNSDVVQLQNALAKLADAQMVIADLGAARNDAPLAVHGKKIRKARVR
ncbi:hypothetical protein [Arcanobacterium hippocoleae]|uniref:hypothetical protein n=1 Tax=Arcanobacterium hippocoleae TaxID=149017 RepID=UPI00333EFB07